ncbi:hypothetical protein BpJC7_06610 [Weizmannia acidilactici]|uniref:Uncharacterized protein n=1 Tax=Weizmannia acidilactici TaxID=2607726 RepID=A0A5J4JGA4_9BACI|nr:hypothetical protein [Weizmannia acidilactici]GER66497.1 hypothetical protein BpJC4_09680 [Weizmannia acidilactici]GER69358.1 hypothetical protein BpJC7_06610 [Weizmannia acidilactici]GER72315.1 hypothetical protein BpPP18_03820 [Weizmannia acidilactici]
MENLHPAHIFEDILPALRENGITETKTEKMLGTNAVGLYGGEPVKVG